MSLFVIGTYLEAICVKNIYSIVPTNKYKIKLNMSI
jgi:hypothetical protein